MHRKTLMTAVKTTDSAISAEDKNCLVRSVLTAFAAEPTLEAVTVNKAEKTINIATLGKADEAKLAERITFTVQQAQEADAKRRCALLEGTGDCTTCDAPLSPLEQRAITIKKEGNATTIARVTCPTAPRFWRWHDIPWPRVVQRDVEFLESAESVDEWKPQLAAAILCGVFGLTAYLIRPSQLSPVFYLLAYLAGGWFTTHEIWERLQKRSIDVHFLMLAVAIGSASISPWSEGSVVLCL